MLRMIWMVLIVALIAACTPAGSATPAPPEPPARPQPMVAVDEGLFVQPDFDIRWQWRELAPDERYVVRLWYGENSDDFREIWTETNAISVQEPIDSYGRDIGDFHWQVAALRTNEDGGFGSMISEWSEPQTLQRVRRMPLIPIPESERSEMARYLMAQDFDNTTEMLHFLRNFVHEHTYIGQDNATSAYERFQASYADAAQMMIDYAEGRIDKGPGLWCDGMTTAMHTILAELGIESRLVFLFGYDPGYINQHTMIEIFNPETQRWQLHDPTFNLYMIDEAEQIATIERLVFGSLDDVQGCGSSGTCDKATLAIVENYFDAFRYNYGDELWVNPDRFDVTERFPAHDGRNFPEFLTGNASDFIFHFAAGA